MSNNLFVVDDDDYALAGRRSKKKKETNIPYNKPAFERNNIKK